MVNYILRRVLIGLCTLVMITFVVYGLIRNMPGDPTTVALTESDPSRKISTEDFARLRRTYGLDQPWQVGYAVWLGNTARGNLDRSISRKQPVSRLIRERVGPTLLLSITSLCLTYLLSIPLGLWSTVRAGKSDERISSVLLFMLYSFPSFVAALFLQLQFAVWLDWLPLRGMVSDNYESLSSFAKTADLFWHAVLPVTCYTYGSLAYYSRFVRANMQEVIRQDYIRTARAKGVGPVRVLVVHAFRNTLIPLVTLIGLTLPGLLGGSVILEQIFTWPGMGRLFFESINERDYPVIMGLTLLFSVLTLASQLLSDIAYALVDPRISYS